MEHSPTPLEGAETSSADPNVQGETAPHEKKRQTDSPKRKSIWREYTEAIIIAMLLAFTIRVFVVQAFKIPSGSMIPSLLIGDHILVNKMAYGFQLPQDCEFDVSFPPMICYSSKLLIEFDRPERGDVIVFRYPENEEKDFIKRIVGIPGDIIQIRDKVISVNGDPLDDKAWAQRTDPGIIDGHITPRDNLNPITVPDDSYFVMGDNRANSRDSRSFGPIDVELLVGEVFVRIWPLNNVGRP